ncbi:MAG: hypothetical protein PHC53_02600 [Patescibacteria group bacterium]|nr:hypothetical protein [Patescibacteria group bacterium]
MQANLRKLKEEKARRLRDEKYRFFEPTGKGEEFVNAVGSGENFISLFSAANGVGKTTLSVNMLAHLFWPMGNQYFQQPLWQKWPYLKKGRIVSDPTTITEALIPELKKWFPAGRYTTQNCKKSYEYRWITDTGFEFDIMSYEQDVKEFESANLGWVMLDEPPPEPIYKACISRLRKGGVLFMTFTPLTGCAWVYDTIIAHPERDFGKVFYLEADVWSAVKGVGVRGFLEKENVEKMIANYSEEDKQARIYGKFQHLTGLIFKQFSRKIHVIRPFTVTMKDFCVLELLDPHPRNPDALMWLAVDRKGNKYVVDELFIKVNSDQELAERIKAKSTNYRITHRFADPSAFVANQHDGDKPEKTLAEKLAKFGLHYAEASKQRTMSDRRIKDALDYQMVGDNMLKAPELFIFDTCERTQFEFEHYRWQEWTGRQVDFHNSKEKPIDKDDHMIENLGRGLIFEPRFVEMPSMDTGLFTPPSLDPY